MRSSKYNAALLAPIVQSSRTLGAVLRTLGLRPTGGDYRFIGARMRQAGLETSHFKQMTIAARCAAISGESLEDLVPQCTSAAQVLIKLDLPNEGRSHREMTRRIRDLEIDTRHFRGRGWSRGETKTSHPSVERTRPRNTFSNAD